MIRSIANKTLASDAEQCRVMVKLFLRNISTGKTGIGQLCNKTYSEITSGFHRSPNGNDNIPYPFN